jgi:hypothetical protein
MANANFEQLTLSNDPSTSICILEFWKLIGDQDNAGKYVQSRDRLPQSCGLEPDI